MNAIGGSLTGATGTAGPIAREFDESFDLELCRLLDFHVSVPDL
jgi:hypothetical protein